MGWRKRDILIEACAVCGAVQREPCRSTKTDYVYAFHVHDVPNDLELRADEDEIETERIVALAPLISVETNAPTLIRPPSPAERPWP